VSISYDTVASDYAIHRSVHPNLLRRLVALSGLTSSSRVLEVGSGTGNYIASIAALTSAHCTGLEPSSGMLNAARQKTATVSWLQGSAESIPFTNGSFDFAYSVDVIHHVQNRRAFFGEVFRILAAGGHFITATDSEETIRQRVPLSHYFPDTIEPEIRRYPKHGEIIQLLTSAGFQQISDEMTEFAYALSDSTPFERKTFSCLHLIPENAFNRGLDRLKRDLKAGPISCVSRYVIYSGRKPV
jgi:ubiquinone/menaquinone biosynthesis C-methylase UbiE